MVVIAVAGGLGRTVYFWHIVVVIEDVPGLELVVVVADAVDVVAGAAVVVVPLPKYSRAQTRQQYFVGHTHWPRPCVAWLVKMTSRWSRKAYV